jgi:ring-1,2-phenylacetyl-CoA epoxidase subunit PaaD
VVRTANVIPLAAPAQAERLARRRNSRDADLWNALDAVCDPEIPVLSLWDLGVLRDVRRDGDRVLVELTPTYSGCPAFEAMAHAVRDALGAIGHVDVRIVTRLAPAWTTDWLEPEARERLRGHGIAPPVSRVCCPNCGSDDTRLGSEFAATACLALYRCNACAEPFHHFKVI